MRWTGRLAACIITVYVKVEQVFSHLRRLGLAVSSPPSRDRNRKRWARRSPTLPRNNVDGRCELLRSDLTIASAVPGARKGHSARIAGGGCNVENALGNLRWRGEFFLLSDALDQCCRFPGFLTELRRDADENGRCACGFGCCGIQ